MHLEIKQANDRTEQVSSTCIDKLYNLSKNGLLDATSDLRGSINATNAYEDAVTFLNTMWGPNLIVTASAYYIRFADPEVESVLKTALNKAEDEGITTQEAAATNIGTIFKNNTDIENFEELKYFSFTNGSFEGCSNLHTVDIGNKNIHPLNFRYCANLEKINGSTAEPGVIIIPEGTTEVGGYMFSGCPKILVVYLPDTLTSLGYRCFNTETRIPGTYLTEIHFGLGISRIDPNVFQGPQNLTKVYIKNLEMWMVCDIQGSISSNHHLYLENDGNPVEITSLDLTGKTIINQYVFYGCSYITSVVLDTALTSIGSYAFGNCTSLVIPNLDLPNLTTLGSYAFTGTKVQTISDLGSVTSIPECCFQNCSQLTTINLNNITRIGTYAFSNCSNLVYFHGVGSVDGELDLTNVTSIGDHAFHNCKSLTSLTLGNSITRIDYYAFQACDRLTSVTIPGSVQSIGNYAFQYCSSVTSLTINEGVKTIGQDSFQGNSITNIVFPNSLKTIQQGAFWNSPLLQTVEIGTDITTIGPSAFNNCPNLISITIKSTNPSGISIGNDVSFGSTSCPIYVPASSVEAYKSASGWSTYADRIQAIPTT